MRPKSSPKRLLLLSCENASRTRDELHLSSIVERTSMSAISKYGIISGPTLAILLLLAGCHHQGQGQSQGQIQDSPSSTTQSQAPSTTDGNMAPVNGQPAQQAENYAPVAAQQAENYAPVAAQQAPEAQPY